MRGRETFLGCLAHYSKGGRGQPNLAPVLEFSFTVFYNVEDSQGRPNSGLQRGHPGSRGLASVPLPQLMGEARAGVLPHSTSLPHPFSLLLTFSPFGGCEDAGVNLGLRVWRGGVLCVYKKSWHI